MPLRLCAVFFFLLLLAPSAPALAAGASSGSSASSQSSSYTQAVKAVEAKNYEQALSLLEEVVADDPGNADAWNYIGYSQRKLTRFDAAERAYKKALELEPGHTGALEYLGELYLETGRPEMARAQLEKLDKACFFGCEEYDDLKEAIDSFERQRKNG